MARPSRINDPSASSSSREGPKWVTATPAASAPVGTEGVLQRSEEADVHGRRVVMWELLGHRRFRLDGMPSAGPTAYLTAEVDWLADDDRAPFTHRRAAGQGLSVRDRQRLLEAADPTARDALVIKEERKLALSYDKAEITENPRKLKLLICKFNN